MRKVTKIVAFLNVIGALLSGFTLILNGSFESGLIGISGLGFSVRLDAVSAIMYLMIALLSLVILKFSINYLDGDQRQGIFLGRLAAALGSVELLVLSGNLGILFFSWVATSLSLQRLLVFYNERPGAIIAAKKKFVVARLSDLFLLIAIIFTFNQFGTGELSVIFDQVSKLSIGSLPFNIEIACIFFALAAIFKSAQFPTHGWLVEVMETPTPVSALLHAGLINAGPFLIIRLAYLFSAATNAPLILMIIGSITAIFGSLVFLTQTSIKTTLAYSSVAHMGFSLMMCGFGAYPAAMLHLVAHSFYKAHSFLSSGSVIDQLRTSKGYHLLREGNPIKIAMGFTLSLATYAALILLLDVKLPQDFHLAFIGAIIMLGIAQLFTSAIDSKFILQVMFKIILMGTYVIGSFILFESAFSYLLDGSIPSLNDYSLGKLLVASAILVCFTGIVFLQIIAPLLGNKYAYTALAIHLKNGLYMNTLFDRMVGALKISVPNVDLRQSENFDQKELKPELIPLFEKQ
ncbi:MAG: proton-conducting transporter membrane subunit [Bacteroidota bacterium]